MSGASLYRSLTYQPSRLTSASLSAAEAGLPKPKNFEKTLGGFDGIGKMELSGGDEENNSNAMWEV